MKVAVYYKNSDVRIEERDVPVIADGEILVKVMASGICGTDVMEWYRIKKAPRILGHEIAGEIVESKDKNYLKGERVFVSHHVPCNVCKYCLDGNHTACDTLHSGNYDPGGYSEYVRVPELNVRNGVYRLPENVSCLEGTMIEPLACVVRGQRVIGIKEGQTVLILGCGVSGILNIQYAKLKGARVVATDIDPYRMKQALEFGADEVIDAREDFGLKADRIIVCTGALSAFKQAFECLDKKGIILLFAIPNTDIVLPATDFWRNEMTVTSSYGAAPVDLEEALRLIEKYEINVKDTITQTLPLTKIQEAFNMAVQAKESLKVVLEPFAE